MTQRIVSLTNSKNQIIGYFTGYYVALESLKLSFPTAIITVEDPITIKVVHHGFIEESFVCYPLDLIEVPTKFF